MTKRSTFQKIKFLQIGANLLILLFICNMSFAQRKEKDKITLQLKWKSQFQFAGYYAAVEKGFYNDVGLDVSIKEADSTGTSVEKVLRDEAQYGIANSELVVHYMNGDPVVVVASILQNSPSCLVFKSSSNINSPKDLIGKNIEIESDDSGLELIIMLSKEGVKFNQIKTTKNSFSLNNLLSNKIDAICAYSSNEPFFLEKFGIPYRVLYPRSYGINFYSDCLFTTKKELENHPDRVKKFRQASLKGWDYALNHPDEMASIIQNKYRSIKTLDHLLFEAEEIRKLIAAEFVQLGHNNKERWLEIVEVLSQQGIISNYRDINDFIYNPESKYNRFGTTFMIVTCIISVVLLMLIGYKYLQLKKRLKKRSRDLNNLTIKCELQQREIIQLNNEIRKQKKTTLLD